MTIPATDGARTATEVVLWLHGDHLNAGNPALQRYPDAPVVFVFDEDFLQERKFAFHRLFFLYESVLDVFAARRGPCSIRRGNVVAEVLAFAREHQAKRIVTTQTLGDRFAQYKTTMQTELPVLAIPVPSLVTYNAERVPKRFSSWWREVEEEATKP